MRPRRITMDTYFTVLPHQLANQVGSGSLEVLSSPWLLGYFENAAVRFLKDHLEEDETTVGTYAKLEHLAPSLLNEEIRIHCELVDHDDRHYHFQMQAYCQDQLIGRLDHRRVKVKKESFMKKAQDNSSLQ